MALPKWGVIFFIIGEEIESMAKYIFVTGGVVSGIGKGLIASSIGRLMKNRGFSVFMQKFDPYINVDPGTMSPYQHGEVFVTKDGAETDLDLGHYERFIDVELTKNASITTGRVYQSVIDKERQGAYKGATVQVIPHITDEIKNKIYTVAKDSGADIIITEIGGTVGDIESLPFLEAVRQVHSEQPRDNVLFIHTTLIPKVPASNELKTKPTQHSFKELMSLGIKTNIIVTRCEEPLTQEMKEKIALFCDVNINAIIESRNATNLYELPLRFQDQGLDTYILHKFGIDDAPEADMREWVEMIERSKNLEHRIKVGLVGKYVQLKDAYLSVAEAIQHASHQQATDTEIIWINSEDLNVQNVDNLLNDLDGIIVPTGFGKRGTQGMILASKYAREHQIPYFGIGMGMHAALLDIAMHLCGLKDANSTEFDEKTNTSIITMIEPELKIQSLGGTMRLGNHPIQLEKNSLIQKLYNQDSIFERHRHRYEFNNQYRKIIEENGLVISGFSPNGQVVEAVELKGHDFYIATQFQPEFKSRPNRSHPLFYGFINAALIFHKKRVK